MPNHIDILQSIQVHQFIKDPLIREGEPELDSRGRPVHYSGGYAMVFPFVVNGEKWAFRCWTAELGNMESRLNTVSRELAKLNLPYFCDFTYVPEGIIVDGKTYPTTRMRWIDGLNIKDYICSHKGDSNKLKDLAKSFLSLAKDMHKHHIAHGDLQHGNILVNNSGELYLIDYDSVYLLALKGQYDIISGLPEYQHPNRSKNKIASEKLDYFSELVIYLSILAIAEHPSLVNDYQVEGSERLLFSKDDFLNLEHSKIYHDLSKLSQDINVLLMILKEYLSKNDINDLQPLEVMLDLYSKEPEVKSFICQEGDKVYEGDDIHITWDIANATDVTLNGQKQDAKGSVKVKAKGTVCTYQLHASNAFKTTDASFNIAVFPVPEISFKSTNKKLRKGKGETATLKWQVQNAKFLTLEIDDHKEEVKATGSRTIRPGTSTTCCLRVVGLDGDRAFKKDIRIGVFSEAATTFKANRTYTLPGVPVTLSWNVQNAKKVALIDGSEVEVGMQGSKDVSPNKDTDYILRVTDAFGQHDEKVSVHMLPLPVITSIQVPAPEIKSTMNVSVAQPTFNCDVRMPEIRFETVDLKLPHVPFLKEAGLYVDLINKEKQNLGMWSKLKSLFQHYNHKAREYESSI